MIYQCKNKTHFSSSIVVSRLKSRCLSMRIVTMLMQSKDYHGSIMNSFSMVVGFFWSILRRKKCRCKHQDIRTHTYLCQKILFLSNTWDFSHLLERSMVPHYLLGTSLCLKNGQKRLQKLWKFLILYIYIVYMTYIWYANLPRSPPAQICLFDVILLNAV